MKKYYGLIKDNVLVQKQTKKAISFVEIPFDAVCGQVLIDGNFVNPEKTEEQLKRDRIEELKILLAKTDYDKDKPDILKQRQEWREELRKLES